MGFEFISIGQIPNPKGTFFGISLIYESASRFLKVTDQRGNPLENVVVTVENLGGDFVASTNSLGIAILDVDVVGTVNLKIVKDKTNSVSTYTYATDPVTKTIILQPRLLE